MTEPEKLPSFMQLLLSSALKVYEIIQQFGLTTESMESSLPLQIHNWDATNPNDKAVQFYER